MLRSANQMMLLAQPSHLQRAMGEELDQEQRRVARATLMRARLKGERTTGTGEAGGKPGGD
jgi:protein-arginine kinase